MKSSATAFDSVEADNQQAGTQSAEKRFYLPRHMRVCWVAEGAVLLDLKCNRYYGLATSEATALRTFLGNIVSATEHDKDGHPTFAGECISPVVKQLLADGFLCLEPATRSTTSVMELTQPAVCVGRDLHCSRAYGSRHLFHFMHAYWWTKSALRHRSLLEISDAIAAQKASIASNTTRRDLGQLIELVSVFKNLRSYTFTAKDQCLLHALMLTKFLLQQKTAAIFCIGVRTRPWAAHSWVQADDMTLDCTPEQIREYTPILAV